MDNSGDKDRNDIVDVTAANGMRQHQYLSILLKSLLFKRWQENLLQPFAISDLFVIYGSHRLCHT